MLTFRNLFRDFSCCSSKNDLTGSAVNSLLEDLELIIEFCEQGAFGKRARDEASLQLVSDVVTCRYLLLGVGRLGQQLQKHKCVRRSYSKDKQTKEKMK